LGPVATPQKLAPPGLRGRRGGAGPPPPPPPPAGRAPAGGRPPPPHDLAVDGDLGRTHALQ
uniref:hypothetical protein n=1 Tax=Nocardia abscessus TaxID=120957 RepID=UPI00245585ED